MASGSTRNASTNWCLPGIVMKSALVKNKLSVCSVNSQSICARKFSKLDELRQIALSSSVDIICVTESWLNDKITDSLLTIEGYKIIRHDRKGRLGGGVLLFIKDEIHFQLLEKSQDQPGLQVSEYVAVEIAIGSEKICLVAMYNPPNVNCATSVDKVLSDYGTRYNDIFFAGDFNTNLLNLGSIRTREFLSMLAIHNVYSIGSAPTFFHKDGSSQLDLMLTSSEFRVLRFNQIDVPAFSNHDTIFASLDFDRISTPKKIEYRDYHSMDVDGLVTAFSALDWSNFYRSNDSNFLLNFFNSNLLELHERYVPIRSFVLGRNKNAWFNDAISKAIVDRDLAYKRWKSTKNPTDLNFFKTLRNQVTMKVRRFETKLDLPSKELWKRIKNIGLAKESKPSTIRFNSDEINENFANNFTESNFTS
ncbi:uncharacterized protein LOC109419486 isoform X1 [Aedes albopictus]|uniref:Endonuclease/exonuclease/phosphatase domain-containing protein n=1 Tax=Aedes albopictus TaxID=7160 RepID=A0ABM1YFN8_AEDAL